MTERSNAATKGKTKATKSGNSNGWVSENGGSAFERTFKNIDDVLLFFEKGAPTRKILFYQLDPGCSLGKTNPLNDDDLEEFVALQAKHAKSDQSWFVDVKDVDKASLDLSVKNPNEAEEAPLREPEEIIAEIAALDLDSAEILEGIRGML